MAKLNTGTRIYGTANVDTSIYVGTSNTTTGTGGILANNTTLFIGNNTINNSITSIGFNTGGTTIANSTGFTTSGFINQTTSFIADNSGVYIYSPLYFVTNGFGTTGYILASGGAGGVPYWRDTVRVNSQTTATSVTIDATTYDTYTFNALGTALTFNASTSATNGDKIIIRITDDGTARALTWTGVAENPRTTAGAFRPIGLSLPTTTVVNKTLYIGCVYNSDITTSHPVATWDAIAYTIEA